jgi:hypothetical protein
MHFYADFKEGQGFRCHPCEILKGPFWDDELAESFYEIEFVNCIPGTIAEQQKICSVPIRYIFDTAIELVDLPRECYWKEELL